MQRYRTSLSPFVTVLAAGYFCLASALAHAQTQNTVTEADNAAIRDAESSSLWPRPAQPLQPIPDRFVLNEWTEAQWKATKLEQELLAHSDGQFVRVYPSEGEALSALVTTPNYKGEVFNRVITLSPTAHTALLQKALFKKLGYHYPAATSVKSFKIHFSSPEQKTNFKNALEQRTQAATDRWIVSETDLVLELRDVAISNESLLGETMPETIVPRVVADLTENVNTFDWVAGTPEQDGYRVSYPEIDLYKPSEPELARVLYRMAKMTRADWEFVVRQANLPLHVAELVTEKLISRAEAILDYFQIPHAEISFDEKVSRDYQLSDGVLREQNWDGYATHFSQSPPESVSPVDTGGRLRNFTRSKLFSLLLGVAVKKFNDLNFMHTRDYEEAFAKHEAAELAKQLQTYQQTGEVQRTPFGAWAYGFASGQLILSRDVVAGSYLGTNHLLQIIDQIGFRINAGGQLTMQGGPHYVEADLGGDIAVSRVYAHIKPIQSLSEARTAEFKNATLPYLLRKNARNLSLESLKTSLKPGESLIITDSLVANADIRAAAILYGFADILTTFQGSEIMLNRFHIHRRDDNTIQIHQDVAETRLLAFAASLGVRFKMPKFLRWLVPKDKQDEKTRIPLYTFRWSNNAGTAGTRFFNVPLSPESYKWLKPALTSSNLEVLGSHIKPVVIRNQFKDRTNEHRFLFWSNRKLKSAMDLTLENTANGDKRSFIRDFFAKTSGRNYEKPGADAVTYLFNALTGAHGLNLDSATAINPGYTMWGKAKNQIVEYEAERLPDGSIVHPYAKVTQAYNGWSLSNRKMRKILKRFSRDSGKQLEAPPELAASRDILLYNISLNTQLSEKSIQRLASLSRNDIVRVHAKAEIPDDELTGQSDLDGGTSPAEEIYRLLQTFKQDRSPKHLMKAMTIANDYLDSESLVQLLGGPDQIHQYVTIEGIAPASGNADEPTYSTKTIEVSGREPAAGPLSTTRRDLNMTEGEFLSQWITGRVF